MNKIIFGTAIVAILSIICATSAFALHQQNNHYTEAHLPNTECQYFEQHHSTIDSSLSEINSTYHHADHTNHHPETANHYHHNQHQSTGGTSAPTYHRNGHGRHHR